MPVTSPAIPKMKIVAGIGGAALPYVIGRLRTQLFARQGKLGDPDAALAAMYYDTIVQDPRTLRYLADIVGADRHHDGLGHAVPDRRSGAAEDRGRYQILRCRARLHQWRPGAEPVRTVRERVMKLDIGGEETIQATVEQLWSALNDPLVLTRCIPGCKTMTEIAPDNYKVEMQLRVAAVGGSFEGEISLFDKDPPKACSIKVSGAGTLGHGNGSATLRDHSRRSRDVCRLKFQGVGEIGGLVAGVGQRILTSVSKHWSASSSPRCARNSIIRSRVRPDKSRIYGEGWP